MEKLKAYLPYVLAGIAALCAGDIATGLYAGKSLLNVQMIPSLLVGGGSLGTLLTQWLNRRFISARVIAPSISDDVPDELVESLAKIAGAKIVAYRKKQSEVKP